MSENTSLAQRLLRFFNITIILLLPVAVGCGGWFGWQYMQQKEQQIEELYHRISVLEAESTAQRIREKERAQQAEADKRALQDETAHRQKQAELDKIAAAKAMQQLAEDTARKIVEERLCKEKEETEAKEKMAQAQREAARKAAAERARKAVAAKKGARRKEAARRKAKQQQQEETYHIPFPQPPLMRRFHGHGPQQPYWPYPYGVYRFIP